MSTFRAPQVDLAALLTQKNPQIDLRIPAYEGSTRNFLKAVIKYKNGCMSTITEIRREHAAEKKRLAEKTHAAETETNQCKLKEIQLLADLERERQELKDAELAVAAYNRKLTSLNEKKAAVDAEIEHYRAITANLRRERSKERSTLEHFAARVTPELEMLERRLACVVEGIEKDQLLVRFTHIDPLNLEREFSFVIDVSTRIYKVLTCTPLLPSLPLLVDKLNTSQDVYFFIANMRESFQELVQQGG